MDPVINYTHVPMDGLKARAKQGGLAMCNECKSLVLDQAGHTAWHAQLVRPTVTNVTVDRRVSPSVVSRLREAFTFPAPGTYL